jgi:hypothetical protein
MVQHGPTDPTDLPVADLLVESTDGLGRRLEPVTSGIPWPRGALMDASHLVMRDEQGGPVPLQARCLDQWPDRSVRWVLLDWQASVMAKARFRLEIDPEAATTAFGPKVTTAERPDGGLDVNTGRARFHLRASGPFPFKSVVVDDIAAIDAARTRLTVEDGSGAIYEPKADRVELIEAGPLRTVVRFEGDLAHKSARPLGHFVLDIHFFAGSATVRFVLTLHNPRKANHPGGFWNLGNGDSIYLRDASLALALPAGPGDPTVRCSAEHQAPYRRFEADFEIYQDSSGGENWQSSNHVNRNRVVPHSFRGYRLRSGGREESGLRSTPIVSIERDGSALAVAMEHFWQNFPKAIEASGDALTLRLFPRQYADVHELQGGEQKTHVFFVAFRPDGVTDATLDWCRAPLHPRATTAWYCASGAIPYLTPGADDPNTTYLALVDAAIEGEDTFERKREVIDEYGWRHFGDVYGDHEAVFHTGPTPLVSHYNNQYDNLAGFAYQFLRSGDLRWWNQMDELARHVIDIDIYHTTRDRSAYNNGLFWHTYHYVDADTSTHRSYPRAGKVCGGGPSGGHNYTTGLMLHHFITGDPLSRSAAIGLARWVIDMDDGQKTIFRWLDRGYHGHATASGSPLYHGPGRAPANSVSALLDGHRLTRDPEFLEKTEQLIRRCIHPADDIATRDLLDAENKWFYTMFLQALGRYMDYKEELGALDRMYAYAREGLLRYARWMADHEYPYLEKPEILEYPTETWAAQDMRKSDVFKLAAKHASGGERARFLERSEFFFRSSTTTLAGMPTRTLARPVILMLTNGYLHAYFQRHPDVSSPMQAEGHADFGTPEVFVPQKYKAIRKLKALTAVAAVIALFALAYLALR